VSFASLIRHATRITKTSAKTITRLRTCRFSVVLAISVSTQSTGVRVAKVEENGPIIPQHPLDLAEQFDQVGDVLLGGGFEAELSG
jgi:hypothetical protein